MSKRMCAKSLKPKMYPMLVMITGTNPAVKFPIIVSEIV